MANKTPVRKPAKASRLTKVGFEPVLKLLKKKYPDAHCALHFTTPYELLVATILSAQCTDERVNKVTPALFAAYPDAAAMSQAPLESIEEFIKSAGFYRNKAKNIRLCSQQLVDKHGGQVPRTLEELYELPGVGRKTAHVVLGNAYGIASGVVVDTHVTRLANRFGWVKMTDAVKIEAVLNRLCPPDDWVMLSHYLIAHGRTLCTARSPKCDTCFLREACPKRGV